MADSIQEQRTASSGNPQEQAMTDEVLATIMSTDHQQPTALQTLASQLGTLKEPQLRSYTSSNVDPLTSLDPSVHTLGYLFFVYVVYALISTRARVLCVYMYQPTLYPI